MSMAGTIANEKGDVANLVIVNRDITDRKRAEDQAEHNATWPKGISSPKPLSRRPRASS
jgi:hypothetical protein